MKLIVVGAGNIGLITALCFANKGHRVYCTDIDQKKIDQLQKSESYIYEPELASLLKKSVSEKIISFSHKLSEVISETDLIFIAVGTPNLFNGSIDLKALENCIKDINDNATESKTIIIKSTVTPRTNQKLSSLYPKHNFISSPEFLREGSAIYDCLHPDRIVVGSEKPEHLDLFKSIYKEFNLPENIFIQMNSVTAEMTKYASNIFLAARISLINEFSRICEKTGADIELLKLGLSLDRRIGPEFLKSGIGYGGSCFPKDIIAFLNYSQNFNEDLKITRAIKDTNELQTERFTQNILTQFKTKNLNKKISIWGASFKPHTDDLREAPALKIIDTLLKQRFEVSIYDPKATANLQKNYTDNKSIQIFGEKFECLKKSEALVICTEWPEFAQADLMQIKNNLKTALIFDGRNIFEPEYLKFKGFEYHSIGRHS